MGLLGLELARRGLKAEKVFGGVMEIADKRISNYDNGSVESLFFSLRTAKLNEPQKIENLRAILALKEEINIDKMMGDSQVLYFGESHDDEEAKVFIREQVKKLADNGFTHFAFEFLHQDMQGKFLESAHSKFGRDSEVKQERYDINNPRRYELFLNSIGECWTDPKFYGEIADEAVRNGMTVVGIGETKQYPGEMGRHDQMADKLKSIFDSKPKTKVAVLSGKSHIFYDGQNEGQKSKELFLSSFPGIVEYFHPNIKQRNVFLLAKNEKEMLEDGSETPYMVKVPEMFGGKKLSPAEKGFDFIVNTKADRK